MAIAASAAAPAAIPRPPREREADRRRSGRDERADVVEVEEAAHEARIERRVVLEHQQRYGAHDEVGRGDEQRHGEEQGGEHGCGHLVFLHACDGMFGAKAKRPAWTLRRARYGLGVDLVGQGKGASIELRLPQPGRKSPSPALARKGLAAPSSKP
jgi:hypothetical protein